MKTFRLRSSLWIAAAALQPVAPGPFVILHHDPYRLQRAPVRESWKPQPARAGVIACRFLVWHAGHWRRLYSDTRSVRTYPHFIRVKGRRVPVSGVAP